MRRPHTTHYFFWLLIAAISLNSACSSCAQKAPAPGDGPAAPVPPVVSSLPFSTKEPARYQADIVISFSGDGAAAEQKYFTARDSEKRRTDYELSGKDTMSVLDLPEGKTIILLPQKKCALEEKSAVGNTIPPQNESFSEFLTNSWLAEKIASNFESLGKENLAGKPLAKYRVRFEKTGGVENISEAVVWVDEELGMPVKTEFYSLKDGQKINLFTTEFRNIKLDPEAGVFDKPEGCQNIAGKDMQKILRQERLDAE
jgi:hypothetical protein